MSDPRLVDIEPGGESTQYESIRTVTQSPSKQTGQLGGGFAHTKSEMDTSLGSTDDSRENNDDENMAQKLEAGGRTTDASGTSDKDMKSNTEDRDAAAAKARRYQGYGGGSGLGA